jgi:hypothetical protein
MNAIRTAIALYANEPREYYVILSDDMKDPAGNQYVLGENNFGDIKVSIFTKEAVNYDKYPFNKNLHPVDITDRKGLCDQYIEPVLVQGVPTGEYLTNYLNLMSAYDLTLYETFIELGLNLSYHIKDIFKTGHTIVSEDTVPDLRKINSREEFAKIGPYGFERFMFHVQTDYPASDPKAPFELYDNKSIVHMYPIDQDSPGWIRKVNVTGNVGATKCFELKSTVQAPYWHPNPPDFSGGSVGYYSDHTCGLVKTISETQTSNVSFDCIYDLDKLETYVALKLKLSKHMIQKLLLKGHVITLKKMCQIGLIDGLQIAQIAECLSDNLQNISQHAFIWAFDYCIDTYNKEMTMHDGGFWNFFNFNTSVSRPSMQSERIGWALIKVIANTEFEKLAHVGKHFEAGNFVLFRKATDSGACFAISAQRDYHKHQAFCGLYNRYFSLTK